MNQEQQDAALGRAIREKGEAERKLKLLKIEASRASTQLSNLATLLERNPEYAFFNEQAIEPKYFIHPVTKNQNTAVNIDLAALSALAAEIRSTLQTIEKLTITNP